MATTTRSSSVGTVAALLLLLSAFVALPVAYSQDEALSPPAPPDPTMAPGTSPPNANTDANANANANTAPEITWTGCVDPEKGYQPVTIGEETTICLVLANDGDWSSTGGMDYMRLNFQPIADQYSRFHVPDSFKELVGPVIGETTETAVTKIFPGNITVHAESQTALSFQKLYYNGQDTVFPFLTAIVAVNEGNVTGITWDNACVFCAQDECLDNTYGFDGALATEEEAKQPVGACHSTVLKCNTIPEAEGADCDLMLYVVWTGTDSNGKDFKSSANRFSAFPKQSWTDRFSLPDISGLIDKITDIIPGGDGDAIDGDQIDGV